MAVSFQFNAIDWALFKLTIDEDLGVQQTDLTTETLFGHRDFQASAQIINKSKHSIVIAGLVILQPLFKHLNAVCYVSSDNIDGSRVQAGGTVVTLTAPGEALLKLERSMLNFLRHLSGIATMTAEFVNAVSGTRTQILDTRKTTPGMRHLEKYAVLCGGGLNHRMGLYDAIMIKDTHVDKLGGMKKTLQQLQQHKKTCPIIIEVRDLDELNTVIKYGKALVDQVLLDNMKLELLKSAVELAKPYFKTEASGNINLNTITAIANTGVDYASVGQITHSAPQVDLSMKMVNQ